MHENEVIETKERLWNVLNRLAASPPGESEQAALEIFSPDAGWLGPHPLNRLHGVGEIVDGLWRPLKESFPDLVRRDDIFMGGHFDGADWISATGYHYGSFERDWLGIPATLGWAYLRYGEFYKLDGGRITSSWTCSISCVRQASSPGVRD
jgi:hypothetical protein